jgi:TolB-like protein/Flp pilus assembly protein TadD
MAFPLPDKPSIAVMPFLNMTGDQSQDFFCDGLSESLIAALSKVPEIFVIARESTFSYKGKAVKISQVSEELGVQYVLEGSVQMAGDRIRVTAQLIDALKGHHLWSERYDRSMKDIFDLQDEIIMKILTELQLTITGVTRTHSKGTDNLQAYLKNLEGFGYANQGTKEANAEAKRLFQEAIALDPNWAIPYANLSDRLYMDLFYGASESPKETLSNAMKFAQKAVELDNSSADGYAALSEIFLGMRQHERAIEAAERAVTLDPNSYLAHRNLTMCLFYAGRSEESLTLGRQAIRLNPLRVGGYMFFALACRETGRYEEGIAAIKKSHQFAPKDVYSRVVLVSLYMYAGREDEARATVAEVQRIAPNFTVEKFAKSLPYKSEATRDRYIESLRKAGLPDKPPETPPSNPS